MSDKITSIQVFGSGCPTCKKLHEITESAAKELGITVPVEYVSDIEKLLALGVMSSPVLVINGQVILAGRVPSQERLKEIIASHNGVDTNNLEDDAFASCCAC